MREDRKNPPLLSSLLLVALATSEASFLRCGPKHVYEVKPLKAKRGVDLISDALPFGRLWYGEPNAVGNAVGYAQFYSRSHGAVICV